MHARPGSLLLALLLPLVGSAASPVAEVNVNVDLTKEGRKIPRPTPAQPTYYAPLAGGFHEEGDLMAGTTPPPQDFVLSQLSKALAAQGYLPASAQTPAPTVLLVFHWGSLNPDIMRTPFGTMLLNEKKMTALVAGNTVENLNPFSERQDALRAEYQDRYFVMVSAYDYAAATQRKKIPLWRAKMSMPSHHVSLVDAVPVLIASGAPLLGRDTLRPVWVTKPLERQGTVNLGELNVEEYAQPTAKPTEESTRR